MTLNEYKDTRSGKKYLIIKESYRDINGKPHVRDIKNFGIITADNREAKWKIAREEFNEILGDNYVEEEKILIQLDASLKNSSASENKNLGYLVLEQIYNTLNIGGFIKNNLRKRKDAFDLNSAIKLLVYSRILKPDSKLDNFKNQNMFFEKYDLKLNNIYDSLDDLFEVENKLQLHIHGEINKLYDRDLELVFYDVTNYFFETEIEDELRAAGVSKEHRVSPIVQMGLLMDNQGIPIAYKLFRGNTHDAKTLVSSIEEFQAIFNIQKITLTADKGLNSGANLEYLMSRGHNFVVSQKVRTKDEKFMAKILDQSNYISNTSNFKIKEFNWERVYNKQVQKFRVVAWWSKDFDDREKHKRGDLEEMMKQFSSSPAKLKASNSHGVKRYLKETIYDKKTGEVLDKAKKNISIDWDKYKRDVALDGYYALITNDFDSPKEEIIKKYRGLIKIEDTFRVIKSDLEGRPVYVRTEAHIKAHFLTCFLALIFIRLIQKKMDWKYSAETVQNALRSAACQRICAGRYLLSLQTVEWKQIANSFNINLDYKYIKEEIVNRVIKKNNKNRLHYIQK